MFRKSKGPHKGDKKLGNLQRTYIPSLTENSQLRNNQSIYLITQPLSAIHLAELEKNSLLVSQYIENNTIKVELYYIDNKGQLKESMKKVNIDFSGILAATLKKWKKTKPGEVSYDFYLTEQLTSHPITFVLDETQGKNQKAFIYCQKNETLFYVDLSKGISLKVDCTPGRLHGIKNKLQMPHGPINQILVKELDNKKGEIDYMEFEISIIKDRLKYPIRANEIFLPKYTKLLLNNFPNPGEYNLYEAHLDIHLYDKTNGYVLTDNKIINQALEMDLQLGTKNKRRERLKKITGNMGRVIKHIASETIASPEWLVDKAVFALEIFGVVGSSSHSGMQGSFNVMMQAKRNAIEQVTQSRLGYTYPLGNNIISPEAFNFTYAGAGSYTYPQGERLAWIISNVNEDSIGKMPFTAASAQSTFICFSKEDAKLLIENLKTEYEDNFKLVQFKPEEYLSREDFSDKILTKEMILGFKIILTDFYHIANYVIKTDKMNDIELSELNDLVKKIEMHLDECEHIIDSIKENPDLLIFNDLTSRFIKQLKEEIIKHPYRGKNNSIPHALLNNIKIFYESLPSLKAEIQKDLDIQKENELKIKQLKESIAPKANPMTNQAINNYFNEKCLLLDKKHGNTDTIAELSQRKLNLMTKLASLNFSEIYLERQNKHNDLVTSEDVKNILKKSRINTQSNYSFTHSNPDSKNTSVNDSTVEGLRKHKK